MISRLERKYGVFTPEILDHLEKLAQSGTVEVKLLQKRALQICEEIRWCWATKFELEQQIIKEQEKLLTLGRENFNQLKMIDELKARLEASRIENGKLRGALTDKDNELVRVQKQFKELGDKIKAIALTEF